MNATTTRKFEGTVDSASPAFQGLHAPATLTLVDRGDRYECQFVFVVGVPISFTLIATKNTTSNVGAMSHQTATPQYTRPLNKGARFYARFLTHKDRFGIFKIDIWIKSRVNFAQF